MFKIGIIGSENSHAAAFSEIFNLSGTYDDVRVTGFYGAVFIRLFRCHLNAVNEGLHSDFLFSVCLFGCLGFVRNERGDRRRTQKKLKPIHEETPFLCQRIC